MSLGLAPSLELRMTHRTYDILIRTAFRAIVNLELGHILMSIYI